jgi:putative FmdB family regulatory protein
MPRYDYKCDCGYVQERRFSMKDRPQCLPCPGCKGSAKVQMSFGFTSFVKGREWDWHAQNGKGMCIPNVNRMQRTNEEQARLQAAGVAEAKRRKRVERRSCSRSHDVEWEHVGYTPLEVHEGVVEATGDKEVWQTDTENLLKKTGCWLGDD